MIRQSRLDMLVREYERRVERMRMMTILAGIVSGSAIVLVICAIIWIVSTVNGG